MPHLNLTTDEIQLLCEAIVDAVETTQNFMKDCQDEYDNALSREQIQQYQAISKKLELSL